MNIYQKKRKINNTFLIENNATHQFIFADNIQDINPMRIALCALHLTLQNICSRLMFYY